MTGNLAQIVRDAKNAAASSTNKTTFLEAASGTIHTIQETTKQAANTVQAATANATVAISDATNSAVHTLTNATSSLTQTAEKTTVALDGTWHKAGQVREVISSSVQGFIVTSGKTWMEDHPTVAWLVAHPFWTIALMLLTLFLSWSLLGAIAQLTQQALLAILQAPLKLAHALLKGTLLLLKRTDVLQSAQLDGQPPIQTRLLEIFDRLESLRQEQEALMKEMQTILLKTDVQHSGLPFN